MKKKAAENRTAPFSPLYAKGGWIELAVLFSLIALCPLFASAASAAEKWTGIDETVIEKYAKEHGREARKPFINTDQGDLLLFVFLIAGVAGGFAAGYYWRVLTEKKAPLPGEPDKDRREDNP